MAMRGQAGDRQRGWPVCAIVVRRRARRRHAVRPVATRGGDSVIAAPGCGGGAAAV